MEAGELAGALDKASSQTSHHELHGHVLAVKKKKKGEFHVRVPVMTQ